MRSQLPLAEFSKFHSVDLDETRQNVAEIFCPHRLEMLSAKESLSTQVNEADFGSSALVYISYGAAVTIDTEELESCFLVQVPWKGQAKIVTNGCSRVIEPGKASIIAPDQAMHMRWSSDCSFFTVRLDRKKLEQCLVDLIGHELPVPLQFSELFTFDSVAGKGWLNAVNFTLTQLELTPSCNKADPIMEHLEKTLCLMLLQLADHNYQAQLHSDMSPVTPKTIRVVRNYIHDNIYQPITIDQLSKLAGIAPATLGKHFRYFVGQSPIKYIRNEKLAAVNKILCNPEHEISVTDVALQYGFYHLGRFSEYYRRRYGELPSETYRKSK